ncbi:hypothetical protein NKDENANG_01305 [Candidatus Entotheonellaceae bacterium PAL068K]
MPTDADSLGSYLRRERESRQVSLQDISAVTKVQLKFLEALEADRYDQLPPAPFVVGFLRAYAQCLALESEKIIAAYYARHSFQEDLEAHGVFVADQGKRSRRSGWVGLSIAAAVIVLVAGFAWRMLTVDPEGRTAQPVPRSAAQRLQEPTEASSASLQLASDTDQASRVMPDAAVPLASTASPAGRESEPPVVIAALSESESISDAGVAELSTVTETVAVEAPGEPASALFVLRAIALEDTWLRVDIDDDERYELILRAGKDIRWEATERFVLKVGNAHGTRLTLNGRDVPLPPTRDNIVRDFVLTRDSVHE